jgi:glyoxylase-like metal-dependent hydrolase (beta-lactamase superfamily II)
MRPELQIALKGAAMSGPLHLDVLVVPYKPIVGLIPPMSKGEATWPATSVSLVSGEHDAVLIDAVFTPQDAGRVVDWVRATGKNLTTIYITHGHGDHFFGLNTILDAFPKARAVTAAAVVPDTQRELSPDLMDFWNTIFPGQIPEHPIVPDALDGDVIDLEGHELRIITVGQSDTNPSTIVYIPSLDAVISGDVAYNGIHQWRSWWLICDTPTDGLGWGCLRGHDLALRSLFPFVPLVPAAESGMSCACSLPPGQNRIR